MHPVHGTEDARLSAVGAYDTIAASYDEQVRGDDWMRRALHAHYRRVFQPGDRVLDVGCGTGTDAIALARLGVSVVGVDGSEAMIACMRDKVLRACVQGLVEVRVLGIEELGCLSGEQFDGLISAFASLNTLPDLAGFAADAARLVRPGGRMVLHLLNRFSLWEWLGYVSRRDWRAARQVGSQRTRAFSIGGQSVPHAVYFADDAYRRSFAACFRRRAAYSLGALRPPHTVRRVPAPAVDALEWLDVRVGGLPLLVNAGRFFVLELERLA